MPSFLHAPPFPIGTSITADAANRAAWRGKYFVLEAFNTASGQLPELRTLDSYRKVYKCVENNSGIALLPKYIVQYSTTAGEWGVRIIGYTRLTAQRWAGVVDDRLPAAGAANGTLFFIQVAGPALCITSLTGDDFNNFSVGSVLVCETAAASTFSTTAGRAQLEDLTGATSLLADQTRNSIGEALTARTTANTASDVLVLLANRWEMTV